MRRQCCLVGDPDYLCTGMESVETAMSSKSNSVETARSAITSKHASPSAGIRIVAMLDY